MIDVFPPTSVTLVTLVTDEIQHPLIRHLADDPTTPPRHP